MRFQPDGAIGRGGGRSFWESCGFSRWDHSGHTLRLGLLDDCIAVVALVGKEVFCAHAFDEAVSKRAIRRGASCNKDSQRHTKRIHGQMYFAVEPPFERSMS